MTGLQFADVGFETRVVGTKIISRGFDPAFDTTDYEKQTWKRGGGEAPTTALLVALQPDTALDLQPSSCPTRTYIQMFKKTEELVEVLQKLSADDLLQLMALKKPKLAESHRERFQSFSKLQTKQACLIFGGKDLRAADFSEKDQKFAEKHLRLVSGLYGVLRPYDDVRPVRDVPMGGKLTTKRGKTVSDFWGDSISKQLGKDASAASSGSGKTLLVSILNDDYHDAAVREEMPDDVKIVRCCFEGGSEDSLRRVRPRLARYLLRNRIVTIEGIKEYDDDDWVLDTRKSYLQKLVFKYRGDSPERKDKKSKKRKTRDASGGSSQASGKAKTKKKGDRSPSAKSSVSRGKKKKEQEKSARSNKQLEEVRNNAYDSDDSGAFIVAPKKRDDAGVRESSRSVQRKRAKAREASRSPPAKKKREDTERRRSRSRRRGGGGGSASEEDRRARGRRGAGGGRRGRSRS